MGTIFVAYGGTGRETVLEFAAERAAEAGDGLYVFHAQDSVDEDTAAVREEIQRVLDRTSADVPVEIDIDSNHPLSDETNVSGQKRLTDALLENDHTFTYTVMGNVQHGTVDSFVLASMTEAVLDTQSIPVLLVPV